MRQKRCWIVLADDGRHAMLGQQTDPNDEQVAAVAASLVAQGLGGWLGVMDGHYHSAESVTLMMVRQLAPSEASWATAESLFLEARQKGGQ